MTKGPCYRANMGCVATSFVLQSGIESAVDSMHMYQNTVDFQYKVLRRKSCYFLLLFFSITRDAFIFLKKLLFDGCII